MKCTSCKKGVLSPGLLDGLFRAHTCTSCGGNWILIEDYVIWKEHHQEILFSVDSFSEIKESTTILLCPVSATLMRKFQFTAIHSHRLDYSSSVGGIWLDKGEWSLLKQEGLAGCLNTILTRHWQNKIRRDSAKENFTAFYEEKFGKESYCKVRELREWLINHPLKADLRAYLLAADPYSAEK